MQFVADGPDIPISLLRAHREGSVIFVVGAGISKAAGLPLFGELADQVYGRLGQSLPGAPGSLASRAEEEAYEGGHYDRLLGLLEQRLVYRGVDWVQPRNPVREAVSSILAPRPRASFSAHANLLDLSRGPDGRPRIVTTNFDTIFERVWFRQTRERLPSSACQSIPAVGSHDFTGVLHIHGRCADRSRGLIGSDLVLTSANFGEAYMRSGWASRLIYDLLRRYTLVFVGYSADDPPMRYMLEATEEGRLNFPDLKPAYALVDDPDGDAGSLREAWRGKGLQPLVYSAIGGDYSALYRTLQAWAEMARDPLGWSEAQLGKIAALNYSESAADDRSKFAFLTKEISSVAVAARKSADPAWIDALRIEGDSLDEWTYRAWFRDRLECARSARYASAASDSVKRQIAYAVDELFQSKHEAVSDVYEQFWALFIQANLYPKPVRYGTIRRGVVVSAKRIQGLVAAIEPRLRVQKRFDFRDPIGDGADPRSIHDLGRFGLEAFDRDWRRILSDWPQEVRAEERLLAALDRALSEACEIGLEAGLVGLDGNLRSFDLAFVHAPEDGDGLVEPSDRHGRNWRLNQPDEYNDSFAPVVRLITGIWRRLAGRHPSAAGRIAENWAQRDAMIFKRLGAWAATISSAGPTSAIENYLGTTSRARYWESDRTAEVVKFYCQRWNSLPAQTRSKIERAICAGLPATTVRSFAGPGRRKFARALYTTRELTRIKSAGGRLSRTANVRLASLYKRFPSLPREMPIYAHLYNPSWSGSGYTADIRVLDGVSENNLLETANVIEADNRIEQGDLWAVFVDSEPARAFAALLNAQSKGDFSPHRWQPFLSLYAFGDGKHAPADKPEAREVFAALAEVSTINLVPLAGTLSRLVERLAGETESPLLPAVLALWDQLVPAAISSDLEEDRGQPLSEVILNHPLANLASALVDMQRSLQPKVGDGLAARLAPRFDALLSLKDRARIIARGALMQQLPYLHWLAPEWAEENLISEALAETDEAIDLMSVVARSVAPQFPRLFNRLKAPIFRALEHDRTDDGVREQLSGALVGAAFAAIDGQTDFELTNVECRHALTRMPNSVLASMALELTSLLRAKTENAARAAYWDNAVSPFLRDYWPNDVSARTVEVSENLVRLPALAGEAFERAVGAVLELICPISRYELRYGFGLDDDDDLVRHFPKAVLRLIVSALDPASQPPSDIPEIIDALLEADPGIAAAHAFWRLRQMQRPS